MSARPIGSATISFGLVSIPIKLYSTGEPSAGVHFNLLHRKCGNRLKQQYVCTKDGELVARDEMAKGYEFSKDQYVLFTEEELKNLQQKASETIDITEFIPIVKVDSLYFDKTYYVGPDKGGDRAFKLLAKALDKSGRAALAKYAARGKQYLVLVRPMRDGLVMHQLKYADEVRPISEVPLGDAEVKQAELDLALQIVKQGVSNAFRPEQYEDEVRQRILKAIEQKVEGQEITAVPEQPQGKVIDLMAALRSSLSEGGKRKPAKQAPLRAVESKAVSSKERQGKAKKSR